MRDPDPAQHDQLPQLGSERAAGRGNEHGRLVGKQGSPVPPGRREALLTAELWAKAGGGLLQTNSLFTTGRLQGSRPFSEKEQTEGEVAHTQ